MKQVIISVVWRWPGFLWQRLRKRGLLLNRNQFRLRTDTRRPIHPHGPWSRIPLFNMTPDGIKRNELESQRNPDRSAIPDTLIRKSRSAGNNIRLQYDDRRKHVFTSPDVLSTYEFVYRRFHFPVSLGAGFAFRHNANYYWTDAEARTGAYWKYSPDWSFGMTAAWSLIPQWYTDSEYNRTGNFLDINAGFRYHF